LTIKGDLHILNYLNNEKAQVLWHNNCLRG